MTEQAQELVDALRMLEHAEYMNHSGHCGIRRGDTTFSVNSGASIRATLTTADVVVVDLDGHPVDGSDASGASGPPLEFPIHAEIAGDGRADGGRVGRQPHGRG